MNTVALLRNEQSVPLVCKILANLFGNVAFQASIKHLKIIALSACLICKSDAISRAFPNGASRSQVHFTR